MFQGIQLTLDGVHLPMDVLLGDVLVSLNLPDSAQLSEGQPALPPVGRQEEELPSSLRPALASTGPAPWLRPTPQCGEGWV